MDPKELRGLYEAYSEVYAPQENIEEGLRSAVQRLLGRKKQEPETKKPLSRGEVLRQRYNVGPEGSDTSAKRQILNRTRKRAEEDEEKYGSSPYSKSVAQKSRETHNRYLRAGYSKYGAGDARGRGSKAARRLFSEGKVAWDDKKNPNPSGYTPKEKSEAKRKQLGVDNPNTQSFEKGGPGEKEYARHGNLSAAQEKMKKKGNQPKGKKHEFKKNPFWKKDVGQVKREIMGTNVPKDKKSSYPASVATANEEVDIYDIILSHLLDEGYAETPEAAEAIMVNMSEEWRESIVEAGENVGPEPKTVGGKERDPNKKPGSPKGKTYGERQSDMRSM